MNSLRGGMQVHAVPDDERATDARGQTLPWGYSYADSSLNRKQPVERGPFGRPTSRRATSKSKTATPGPRDDPVNLENLQTIDDIFGKFKKEQEEKENKAPREQRPAVASSRLPQTQFTIDAPQPKSAAPAAGQAATFKEPTEVLLYGYNSEDLSSAIEYFETISLGRIYEDYDRSVPNGRYNSFLHHTRTSLPRTLPASVMRKINTYSGGDHWIKVTFDSPEAAERACFYSPHILHGYSAYAEPWRGEGPSVDAPIYANSALSGAGTLSQRRTAQPHHRKPFSTMPSRTQSAAAFEQSGESSPQGQNNGSPDTSETLSSVPAIASGTDAASDGLAASKGSSVIRQSTQESPQKPLRVRGATRAVLRPYTEAFLPVAPWSQRTFGHLPLIGSLFGGDPNSKPGQGGGIIGNAVPRKEDGTFDWDHASVYWQLCWFIDHWLGTDLCGMKGDD